MTTEKRMLVLGESAQIFGKDISTPASTPTKASAKADHKAVKPHRESDQRNSVHEAFTKQFQNAPEIVPEPAVKRVKDEAKHPKQPQAVPELPTPTESQQRLREIARIQLELVRRRRNRLAVLLTKLAFFVFLPTLITGAYFYWFATPLFETHSEFVIQKASPAAAATGVTSLFSGTALGSSQDSIIVQGYLTSREAMLRLDSELGFKAHFSTASIDPLLRLSSNASDEDAFAIYSKKISVGFDPTEGILRMSVVAASAEDSQKFAEALVRYAEERVDRISQRAREDQMAGAQESYDEAEINLNTAQKKLVELQQLRGVLSTEIEVTSQMSIINSLELELEGKSLELQEILSNPKPNQTKADLTKAELERLRDRIQTLRSQLTNNTEATASLAKVAGELLLAETDVSTRQLLLQQAVAHTETAREEANRQARYLAMGVSPIAPDVATLPRKFESTALAGLIFAGLYLLASLTVSILREQVSV